MWRVALILVLAVQAAAADQPARPTCDAAALEKEGDTLLAQGSFVAALDKYDKAVRCESVENRVLKAGFVACEVFQHSRSETDAKRAKRYYDMLRLQSNKDKLAQACTPRCRLEY